MPHWLPILAVVVAGAWVAAGVDGPADPVGVAVGFGVLPQAASVSRPAIRPVEAANHRREPVLK
jgi:hypothetical protein